MLRPRSTFLRLVLIASLPLLMAVHSNLMSATIEWDDGQSGIGAKQWSRVLNWSPNVLPSSTDDVVIGNLASAQGDATLINQDFSIGGLSLMSGASADTLTNRLMMNGLLDIGLASRFVVSQHGNGIGTRSLQIGGTIDIANLGSLQMNGGYAAIGGAVNVNLGGRFEGFGDFQFTNGLSSPVTVFTNNGTLSTGRAAGSAATEHFTLRIRANDIDALIDLDGTSNNRVVNIVENTTLDMDMWHPTFAGTMTLGASSVFDNQFTVQASNGATFNVNAATSSAGVADVATIRGGIFNLANATVNVNSGTLAVESDLIVNAQSSILLAPGSALQLDGNATISGRLSRTAGGSNDLIIHGETTLEGNLIHWGLQSTDDTTIGPGATLVIRDDFNVGTSSENLYRGDIFLNGGTINIRPGGVVLAQGIRGDVSTDSIRIEGSLTSQASISALGSEALTVNGSVNFVDSGSFITGGDLATFGSVGFGSGVSHLISGDWTFYGGAVVDEDTTVEVTESFRLNSNFVARTHEINADWTIQAEDLGGSVGGDGSPVTFDINSTSATLTVNLTDPNDAWTLGPSGTINLTAAGTLGTTLAGSAIHVEGTINVDNAQRTTARIELESTGIIDLDNNASLHLNGGNQTDRRNRINGGFINGNGTLFASNTALSGHGTINPDIAFSNGADLIASGGTLVVNGEITNADVVRVESGARLLSPNLVDTANFDSLQMRGGTFQGTGITNSGRIEGYGRIEVTELLNIGIIQGAIGGDLIIDTVNAPDLDGIDGVNVFGELQALFGSIVVVDALDDDFSSTATIRAGHALEFQQGWRLDPNGQLNFEGSSTTANLRGGLTLLDGTIDVDHRGAIHARTALRATAQVTLNDANDELWLYDRTDIAAGATMTGAGRLVNKSGGELVVSDGSQLDVTVVNEGGLEINNTPGIVGFRSFTQTADGVLDIDILSLTGNHQRIELSDGAILDGTLDVSLFSTLNLAVDDEFTIISTSRGSIAGNFANVLLPALNGDLDWLVDYSAREVTLRVVSMSNGDFNDDGTYDCADADQLVAEIANGSNDLSFDLTGDGNVNADDLNSWLAEAGAAELASGNAFLQGDANLDGVVDASDFNVWNSNKFTSVAAWCSGDFNADGSVDTSDFNIWNSNKFQSANDVAAVPEPSGLVLGLLGAIAIWRRQV